MWSRIKPKHIFSACVLLGLIALVSSTLFSCVTYKMGPTQLATARDDAELAGRIYRDLDAGRDRAYARGLYCDQADLLKTNGSPIEAGVVPCEVTK